MEKAFIKQNGVVKEVLISAIRCEYDGSNQSIQIKNTKCLHQGEEIGWGKRTYYKDKLCTNVLDLSSISYCFNNGEDSTTYSMVNKTFGCYYNDNGVRNSLNGYAKEICFTEEDSLLADVVLCQIDGTPLEPSRIFNSVETYNWYNETTIHHNDGTVEVIGGTGKNWEFNEKQTQLIEQFLALQQEMKDNKIRIVFDGENWDLFAVNEEKMQLATNDRCNDEREVEGCDEWETVPTRAFKGLVNGWCSMNYDTTLHYKKRE